MKTPIAALVAFIWALSCDAYEMSTHWHLSRLSWNASMLAMPAVQRAIGLDRLVAESLLSPWQEDDHPNLLDVSPDCHLRTQMSAPELLNCGAMYEDVPGKRSLNHFYDPANKGIGLTTGITWGSTSPDWALEDNGTLTKQQFSYRDARQYFFNALTTPGWASRVGGRNEYWAGLFQSLGHVIHHIQDMAQPQHVRNDPHLDLFDAWVFGQTLGHVNHPSRFERYTGGTRGLAAINRYAPLAVPVYPAYVQHFKLPRDFWASSTQGLAKYTNANFVSTGTNFIYSIAGVAKNNPDFPLPVPAQEPAVNPAAVFSPVPPTVAQLCQDVGIANCKMTFYSNTWKDSLTNEMSTNLRASTSSLFDEDLTANSYVFRKFALNQANFEASYQFLIPRAVAYSAGLLNYFFRGQMEVLPPADGVYALVDHQQQRCANTCGFDKVKLKLKNTTPAENMTLGEFRAIAKFHRNVCYSPELLGDSPVVLSSGTACRSSDDDAVVSDPQSVASLGAQEEREFTFTFPTRIPINATDLSLQVVFVGTLGAEVGAVAVTTKDISEPNYLAVTNVTDMVYDFATDRYRPLPYGGYSQSDVLSGISVAFKPNGNPLATLSQLAAPGHAQLAFLTDLGQQYLDVRRISANYTVNSPMQGLFPVSEFVSPPNSGLYGRTVELTASRGVFRNIHLFHRLPADNTIYSCQVEVELCAQTGMSPFTPGGAAQWSISF